MYFICQRTPFSNILKWAILFACLFSAALPLQATQFWQPVAAGLEYQKISLFLAPWSHIHVFRIQLKNHTFALVRANELGAKQAFVKEIALAKPAPLAINGGFFDNAAHPLGLRITNGQSLSAAKPISWWNVFYIAAGKAYIQRVNQLPSNTTMQFAIQSGPRLLRKGKIPTLKPGRDERTAIGITQTGEVILVVTENALLTTTELAEIMQRPPIAAIDALNLDGGSSTQLYANFPDLQLNITGVSPVADAVLVR